MRGFLAARTPVRGLDVDLRRFRAERPPVLLLGGLNLLRPLGFARIPVIVGSSEPDAPAFASRYCSGRCLLPPMERRDEVLETLLATGERLAGVFGSPVPLFYGNDGVLDLIQECRGELSSRFRLILNDPEVARALIAKDRFAALARSRGLPVPRTLRWDGDCEDSLAAWHGPVAVKPNSKVAGEDSPVHGLLQAMAKARVFPCSRDVLQDPLVCALRDKLTFQEYVAGDDRSLWSFHGFADERGILLSWFIGRKVRTYPGFTGSSSFLELAHDSELAALGKEIVTRVPLKGAFKIDLKKDMATGAFRVLEINARFNLWHHLAARSGVNLPQVAYEYLVHGRRPLLPPKYGTGMRWVCLPLDIRAYRELAARGELGAGRWLLSLARSRKVYDLFSWTDAVPALRVLAGRLASRRRRWLGRLRSQLHRWRSTAS